MPRIFPIDTATATGDAVAPLATMARTFGGRAPNLFTTAAQSPAAVAAMVSFFGHMGKASLGPKVGWMQRTGANGFGPRANSLIDIGRPDLDFVKLSQGLGVEASRARTTNEFIDQFRRAMRERGPRLIEAVID